VVALAVVVATLAVVVVVALAVALVVVLVLAGELVVGALAAGGRPRRRGVTVLTGRSVGCAGDTQRGADHDGTDDSPFTDCHGQFSPWDAGCQIGRASCRERWSVQGSAS